MDVILLKDVEKVGLRGDVVSVSRGYMRNYLGPRRLAEEATPARVAELSKRDAQRARLRRRRDACGPDPHTRSGSVVHREVHPH